MRWMENTREYLFQPGLHLSDQSTVGADGWEVNTLHAHCQRRIDQLVGQHFAVSADLQLRSSS